MAALLVDSAPKRATPGPSEALPSGPVLFARYAYGPNRLGYCGPDAADELFDQAAQGRDEAAIRSLARGFEGAWPYLELIAQESGLEDPLDRRVVEAYWLGGDLLRAVSPTALARSMALRFRPRLTAGEWHWLEAAPADGARPLHAFHVLDVFPRVGLLRGEAVPDVLRVMDSCRIRWGRVLERDGDWLVVDAVPLEMVDGRLRLGPPRAERIRGWRDGQGFVAGAGPGDVVSIHWDWACDRLDEERLRRLVGWSRQALRVANRRI
jgi:hypothetical protein